MNCVMCDLSIYRIVLFFLERVRPVFARLAVCDVIQYVALVLQTGLTS